MSCLNSELHCCSHKSENWSQDFFTISNYDVLYLVAMTIRIPFGLLGGKDSYSNQAESVKMFWK